ncbi:MAG: sodium:calcium symporter [Verrucomicrobiales bacterium]|nr:sodium:calcium symporter [Verrucomicrobiales bacterium]
MASLLMVWRLEAMSDDGLEGTVLGTLVMPYCSGLGNLVFVFLMARQGNNGDAVITNCLVNNVTNLTLLLGLPAIFWRMRVTADQSKGKKKKNASPAPQLNRLSLLLTLAAVLFFSGVTWALGRDGHIDFSDGLVLVGIFLFWQCIHIFEVLKNNVRQNKSLDAMLLFDLALLGVGACGIFMSTEWLVNWLSSIKGGFVSAKQIGWLSGWLMVLPNALLAFYYSWRKQPETVYSSQVGDGHICIPLCIGLYALFHPITVPSFFELGIFLLVGAAITHFVFVLLYGGVPRWVGAVLTVAYGVFVYKGLFE